MKHKKNHKQPTDFVETMANSSYQELIRKVHYFDEHIAALANSRDRVIEQIKKEFKKTDENIEFELNKLRKG